MMTYEVLETNRVLAKLDKTLNALMCKYGCDAARNWLDDYEETLREIEKVAGSYHVSDLPPLRALGLKRINFRRHKLWFFYFSADGNVATVEYLGHDKENPDAIWGEWF